MNITLLLSAFASKHNVLGDISMVHGRMIVSAWDYGLDGVEDNAVRLLTYSLEVILISCLSLFKC